MGAGTGGDPAKKHICAGIKHKRREDTQKVENTNETSHNFRKVKEEEKGGM